LQETPLQINRQARQVCFFCTNKEQLRALRG
jgi:hypothetical protein